MEVSVKELIIKVGTISKDISNAQIKKDSLLEKD